MTTLKIGQWFPAALRPSSPNDEIPGSIRQFGVWHKPLNRNGITDDMIRFEPHLRELEYMKPEGQFTAAGERQVRMDGSPGSPLTPLETGFSSHAAAAKCDEVSLNLVRLAELLRSTCPDASPLAPPSERAMVDCVIRARRLRDGFFEASLFADPAWDILLDLYLAHLDQRRTTVTALCAAASVPMTTGLRHIAALVDRGLILRAQSARDLRVVHVELADASVRQMQAYFARLCEILAAACGR